MRRTGALVGAAAATMLVAACGGGSKSDNPIVAPASATPGPIGCGPAPSAAPAHEKFSAEPKVTVSPTTYTATIITNCGLIVASLDAAKAPHTVNSFAFLAAHHYFDNTKCHRLTTRETGIYVLQCGDPTGTGAGGPGYTLPEENLKGATYPAGTLAMARTQAPHSGGSQFFICYDDTPLPPQYTPFGRVVQGLDVLQAIARNGEDDSNGPGDGHPKKPVVIESFTVTQG